MTVTAVEDNIPLSQSSDTLINVRVTSQDESDGKYAVYTNAFFAYLVK